MWLIERFGKEKVEVGEEIVTQVNGERRAEEFDRLTERLERRHDCGDTILIISGKGFKIQETSVGRLLISELVNCHHGIRKAHQRSLDRTANLLGAAGIRIPDTTFEDIKGEAQNIFRNTQFLSGAGIWEVALKRILNSQAGALGELLKERGVEEAGLEIVVDHLCRGLTLEELGRKFFPSVSRRKERIKEEITMTLIGIERPAS
jgi:hypothetical protein